MNARSERSQRDKRAIELWNKFDAFMYECGYNVWPHNDSSMGRGSTASVDDKFASVFELCVWGGETPSVFVSIHVNDRNGHFALDGDTAAIFSMVDTGDKEKNAELFDFMLNDVYKLYSVYSKENRLDLVFNGLETRRETYDENTLEDRKVLSAVEAIARKAVSEYEWNLPSYSFDEYESYGEYENDCLDLAHEARLGLYGTIREALIEAGVFEPNDDTYYEAAEEIIWNEITDWVVTHEDAEIPKADAAIEVYFDNVRMDTVYCTLDSAGAVISSLVQNGYDNYNGAVKEDWEREGGRANPDISFHIVKLLPEKVNSVDKLIGDASDKSSAVERAGKDSPEKDISLD